MVKPSACPRETIVILCTGSVFSRKWPTRAWPISWYAVILRSCSLSRRVFFSGPAMTRMIPSSSSSCWIVFFPRRAASSAASLTRFARSAPVNPGVPAASVSRSMSGASGLPFACTSRIFRRPTRSGRSTTICRSKRPGRRSAGSRMSGRFVAAAAEPGAAVPADGVDLVHEDDARRRLLRLLEQVADARGADADEHLDEVGAGDREEGDARLPRDSAREQRLPRAGRPVQEHALRDPRPERLELLGVLEELLDLVQLLDRLVCTGDVLEGHLRRVGRHPLGAALAEAHHLRAAALDLVHEEDPEPDQEDEREQVREQRPPRRRADALGVEGDVLLLEQILKLRRRLWAHVVDLPLRAVDEGEVDLLLVRIEDDVVHIPALDLLDERGRRVLLRLRAARKERLARQVDEQDDHDQREECATEKSVHGSGGRVSPHFFGKTAATPSPSFSVGEPVVPPTNPSFYDPHGFRR